MIEYLTEENLKEYVELMYPDTEWVHDKRFKDTRYRPDYVSHEKKLIVEFDGYQHYTSTKAIIRDKAKDKLFSDLGYKVVRIPYFVQMSNSVIKQLFGLEVEVEQKYRHGFIADNSTLVLPCDYCYLGIEKFKEDLKRFSDIKEDIIKSLKVKAEKSGNWDLVLPKPLKDELIEQ